MARQGQVPTCSGRNWSLDTWDTRRRRKIQLPVTILNDDTYHHVRDRWLSPQFAKIGEVLIAVSQSLSPTAQWHDVFLHLVHWPVPKPHL